MGFSRYKINESYKDKDVRETRYVIKFDYEFF